MLSRLSRFLRRRRLWYARQKAFLRYRLGPGDGELTPDDVDMLGRFYELPHWKVLSKYLELSRNQFRDNALAAASDMLAVGEVKGNINMCNLIESDMHQFWETFDERKKAMEMEVAIEEEEEQDADVP